MCVCMHTQVHMCICNKIRVAGVSHFKVIQYIGFFALVSMFNIRSIDYSFMEDKDSLKVLV